MISRLIRFMPYLVASLFITPLIIRGGYIFPFIVPKILFLRSIIVLMLGVYALLLIADFKRFRPRFSILTISVLLFWLSFAISTFTGVDWYRSFWDNHERMLGLFTITHYTILYLIAAATLSTDKHWTLVFRSALLLGSAVMLVGVWQRLVNPTILLNQGSTRVSATLGNAIYYSSYGLFILFLGVIQFIRERSSKVWKWIAVVCAGLGFIGIFLGGTRGTILGLLAGTVVVLACYLFFVKEKTKYTNPIRYAAFVGTVLVLLAIIFRHTTFVNSLPAVGRLVNTSFITELSSGTRGMAWKIAVEAWKDKPVFGWGPNNYYYAFNEYYNPAFLEFGWGETWFDNAHSVIFNTLTVQGVVGIVTYLTMYAISITMLGIGIRRGVVSRSVGFLSIGFLVAHLVGLATVFENPTSYLYFFIFLGFVTHLTRNVNVRKKTEVKTVEKEISANDRKVSGGSIVLVAVVLLVFLFITNINPARANKATTSAMQKIYSGTATAGVYDEPLRFGSPHADDIRNDISRSILEVVNTLVQNKKTENLNGLFSRAIDELQVNRRLHPLDIRVNYTLYTLFDYAYQLSQDKTFLAQSEQQIREALVLSPKRQQFEYALAQTLIQQQRFDEAKQVLTTSIHNHEKIAEGWYRMALLYLQQNDLEKAQAAVAEALSKDVVFSENHTQLFSSVGITTTKK